MKTKDKLIVELFKDALQDPELKRQIVKELLTEIRKDQSAHEIAESIKKLPPDPFPVFTCHYAGCGNRDRSISMSNPNPVGCGVSSGCH